MTISQESWRSDTLGAECGKSRCPKPATRVVIASPTHRVVSCDEHMDELYAIKRKMQTQPVPSAPPETMSWRRDDRP